MIAAYHDDPETTPQEELRSDAALTVPPTMAMPDGLVELRLPAGKYACATHVGPYTALGDAWARLMGEWLPKSGYRVGDGMSFEIYRNTPADVAPSELQTELHLPLA
jgi:AraC family transcriptional regulator